MQKNLAHPAAAAELHRWAHESEQMPQAQRDTLEKPLQLRHAKLLLAEFLNDSEKYPDGDFYLRKGICKDFLDEYYPLVQLAKIFRGVRTIGLLSQSNPGPDAIITFWWRRAATVQITCAHESYMSALEREKIHTDGRVLIYSQWKREKATGRIVGVGTPGFKPSTDIQTRVERIRTAISAKESKYYSGTEILLIQDDSANLKYLRDGHLHDRVCEAVRTTPSHYRQIYVNYGECSRRVK